ncbi:MAG: amidohydrolase family protein, partial [Solirubrobacterales bacterium]
MANGRVIDVHAHVTPQRFQRVVLGGDDWHGMTAADGELDNLPNRWLPERRIEEMDAIGVDVQVVSPTDVFYQYDRDPETTATIARECNEEIAEMVRDHPDRFMG